MRTARACLFCEGEWRDGMQISLKPVHRKRDRTSPGLVGLYRQMRGLPPVASPSLLWRLYQHAWLVCLFFPLVSLVREPVSTFHCRTGTLRPVLFCGQLHLAHVAPSCEPGNASTHSAPHRTRPAGRALARGHCVQPGVWSCPGSGSSSE